MESDNSIHIDQNFTWFLGRFDHNQNHRHYAIQLSIPLDGRIDLQIEGQKFSTEKAVLIKPNIEHQLSSEGIHLLILLNPISSLGHYWNRLTRAPFVIIEVEAIQKIKTALLHALATEQPINELKAMLNKHISSYNCECDTSGHTSDERIDRAIAYLYQHSDRLVPLTEIAAYSCLSASRFLHLFKNTTGITYRRAQLWIKIMKALPLLKTYSFTRVAHEVGFADSAHLSRTFKENFGFSPRAVSRF